MWDGSQLMMTVSSDETVSYAKAPGYMRRGTSKDFNTTMADKLYLFNAHGDVTAMTDKNAAVIKTYEYDAFGNELNPSANDTNPFRYCGEYYDEETGSIYLRARYYNPTIGRFTAEDPIKDGLNWYAYCGGGNPVMSWDPSGFTTEKETEMYKNGELSPGAYAYLSYCTYEYFLYDNYNKGDVNNVWYAKAKAFRYSGYTDTGDAEWNRKIALMDSIN